MSTKKVLKKTTIKKASKNQATKRKENETERLFEFKVSQDVLQGKYSNVAVIRHTKREFALEFILDLQTDRSMVSRIITSPEHAKEIYKAIGDNIEKYEKKFGKIIIDKQKK